MNPRRRWQVLLAVVLLVAGGTTAYAASAFQTAKSSQIADSAVDSVAALALPAEPFIMFRNTAPGQGFGEAATVALADPSGQRALSGHACDRVYAVRDLAVCLLTKNEIPTNFEATVYNGSLAAVETWPLAGVPSRTRISPDGTLLATTVFVSGHSYSGAGFSTETLIRGRDGTVHGNLEEFALFLGGSQIKATDRNIWGVTFVPGQPDAFYATASSQGKIWLLRGSLNERTLTVTGTGIECPSVSPDGTRIAYKKSVTGSLVGHRNIAVLELATGTETILAEQRDIDDQMEWLDARTVVYGVPRDDSGQDSDVWSASIDPGVQPSLLIEHAWSPAVVRQ
ncbi:TolB family protein [Pseudarthrobacter sp. TAF60_1]|uniref:TolB family protein n=1 Tax=Pseudarthrobacter sp. TAF60_1 TaxID=3233071 RepID=UPI003F9B47C0